MTTISDFTVLSLTGSDSQIVFGDAFPSGVLLIGKYGNDGFVHMRAASGCTTSNAPALPTQASTGSFAGALYLPASLTGRNDSWHLTVSSGTQSLVIIPA